MVHSASPVGAESGAARVFGAIAACAVQNRWLVIVIWILVAVGSVVLAGNRLGINTDTTDMLSPELPFRKSFATYRAAFPQGKGALVVVVSGPTSDLTDRAARQMAVALAADKASFQTVFFPQGSAFFRKNGLLYLSVKDLEALSERLAEAQPLLGLFVSEPNMVGLSTALGTVLTNIGASKLPQDQLISLLNAISTSIAALAKNRSRPIDWSTLLGGFGASRTAVIVTQPVLDFSSLSPAKAAMQKIRAFAQKAGLTLEKGYTVRLTGSAAIASEEIASVSLGAGEAGLLSLVLVIILLLAGLRQVWSILAVVVTLIVGLAWTLGFVVLAIGALNLLSVAFAVLFIGLGVDFGIHFALRAAEAANRKNRASVYRAAGQSVGPALALAAAAASLSFLAFLFTDYRGVAELGLIAAVGMVIALASCLTFLPAIMSLRPLKPARLRTMTSKATTSGSAADRAVVIVAAVLGLGAIAATPFAHFDRNPLNLKDPRAESVRTAVSLVNHPRYGLTPLQVIAGSAKDARTLAARLKVLPEVRSVRTLFSFIPDDQMEKRELIDESSLLLAPIFARHPVFKNPDGRVDLAALRPTDAALLAALERLKTSADTAAVTISNAAMKAALRRLSRTIEELIVSGAPAGRLQRLNADVTHGLVLRLRALAAGLTPGEVTVAPLPADLRARYRSSTGLYKVEVLPRRNLQDRGALRRFVEAVQRVAPAATGSPAVELFAGNAVVNAFLLATAIAAGLIILLLFLVLKRPSSVFFVLAPVALAGLLTIGTAVVFDLSFNFANIIAMPLLIGLGAAGGIHVVARWRRGAGDRAASTTPRAILFSALTTVASFGTLAISPHRGTASMGELLMTAIGWSLVCTLIALPAALRLVSRRRGVS